MSILTGEDTMGNGMRFYDISKVLKAKRLEEGLSMRDLASVMGTSIASISCWERGIKSPTLVSLLLWCDCLGYEIHLAEVKEKG